VFEIRAEQKHDRAAVHAVHVAAFPTDAEADLVDRLRSDAAPIVSLVAVHGGVVAGHLLFSPVTIDRAPKLPVMGLAPMAVLPDRQREGLGSALVHAGLDCCRERGARAVVVLGHPDYYPRFGFVPASRLGLRCVYDAPDEAFLALELAPGALAAAAGTAHYHSAFGDL